MNCNWGQYITLALVVLGWAVVNHQNNRRETRREVRAAADVIEESLVGLLDRAISFHQAASFDQLASAHIVRVIQQISRDLGRLSKEDMKITAAIIDLRKAITLNNFDRSSFRALDSNDAAIWEISDSADYLKEMIEEYYDHRFRSLFK